MSNFNFIFQILIYKLIIIFFCIFNLKILNAQEIPIIINGNEFTDDEAILSIIGEKPTDISDEYLNYLLKSVDNSNLFQKVTVKIINNSYVVNIIEFPNIDKITFKNNDRLKDEDLYELSNSLNLNNLNPNSIQKYIDEIDKIYQSFGYNNLNLTYETFLNQTTNTADIVFNIDEGEITKINRIFFNGNTVNDNVLKSLIKSKTKTLRNIFANNNFKLYVLKNDIRKLSNYYLNEGYRDISIEYKIEYLKTNKVNIYFDINEGKIYKYSSIEIIDSSEILNETLKSDIKSGLDVFVSKDNKFSPIQVQKIKKDLITSLNKNGVYFFEIKVLEKITANKVNILFDLYPVEPKYTNQINVKGNYRTFDYVIRREIGLSEGDHISSSNIKDIENKLKSLNLFKSVEINEINNENKTVDLDIVVEEKQTGTFSAGVAVGTLDGFSVIAGLNESNFGGTGRSIKTLINTSENSKEFTLETEDRIAYEDNVDLSLLSKYTEDDFTNSSSYKLNTFKIGSGITYDLAEKLRHRISFDYALKDYIITKRSTAASQILESEGMNVSLRFNNVINYNNLNSAYNPTDGNHINFFNSIESPTSSNNGYIKNIVTLKQYKKNKKNIYSNQTRLGNITSLSNNDILTDDKFSLGGRWLRGFDVYGAGPRNSQSSYVGGNNLIVTKFDYQRELFDNSDFPVYLNLFNDYGIVWDNKTTPTNSDSDLRSSYGFGIKYYSPIGPIGFTWGFPLMDKSYDIKRMFLFSVGNLN